jgi:hypothetical protein
MRIAPPNRLAEARYRTVEEAEILKTLLIAAQPFELATGHNEAAIAKTLAALERWVNSGLQYAVSVHGTRLFDPVEVTNHMKWLGLQEQDDFWSEHFVRTGRAFARDLLVGQSLSQHFPLPPARFNLTLRRKFDLSRVANRKKLRLRLPLPLTANASEIEVEPQMAERHAYRVSQSDGRLEFQMDASLESSVEIGADIRFTTTGSSSDNQTETLDGEMKSLYLRPNDGLVQLTPRVCELATSLGGDDGTWETALRCWNFVIDELSCGMVRYDQVDSNAPGDWVLESGWYDCQLGSSLFIGMCRSRGIPARLMSGQMLYQLAPGFHYWAEVWMPDRGWLPFDLLSWDLSEGGRDKAWREYFAGKIDYRMVTQCLPLAFTGPMSVRFPAAWHLTNAPSQDGMKINFTELDGHLIYSDEVAVKRIETSPQLGTPLVS